MKRLHVDGRRSPSLAKPLIVEGGCGHGSRKKAVADLSVADKVSLDSPISVHDLAAVCAVLVKSVS